MPLTERQINAAVAWWQGVVRRPKFDNLGATRETVSSRERELHRDAQKAKCMRTKKSTKHPAIIPISQAPKKSRFNTFGRWW